MQQILQQLASIADEADESSEERADRLQQTAENVACEPTTLYEVEEDIRGLGEHYASENNETVQQAEAKLSTLGMMMGMDQQTAQALGAETAIKLIGQLSTAEPAATAHLVKSLHECFERRGLYEELATDAIAPGTAEPTLSVSDGES